MTKRPTQIRPVSMPLNTLGSLILALTTALSSTATAAESALYPMFRSDFGSGLRAVALVPPSSWHLVPQVNRDPLSIGQWIPNSTGKSCASGADARLSLYAVDSGNIGPQRLMQRWFPGALQFNVLSPEGAFTLIRAEGQSPGSNGLIAIPQSEKLITPLPGWISGVKIVIVGESPDSESLPQLEADLRASLKNIKKVAGSATYHLDRPYVLIGKKWTKALYKELSRKPEKRPASMMSLAYGHFAEANGFVPAGQIWIKKAAELGHLPAQAELLRLSRQNLLTIGLETSQLDEWRKSLIEAGQEDETFLAASQRPFDEVEENIPSMEPIRKLAVCGHREAKIVWAKHLAESFKKVEQRRGRDAVYELMKNPILERDVSIYNRPHRGIEAPTLEKLKSAALLKTACKVDDGAKDLETDLMIKKSDLKVPKGFKKTEAQRSTSNTTQLANSDTNNDSDSSNETAADVEEAELKVVRRLDTLVNTGGKDKLKEAQKIACTWTGPETDRNRLAMEVAARREGFGKWRPFRACSWIEDPQLASVCRARVNRQANINLDAKFEKLVASAGPTLSPALHALRKKSQAYAEALLKKSYDHATVSETRELDRLKVQIESEFMALAGSVLANNLDQQVRDVIRSRRLMVIDSENTDIALYSAKPASRSVASSFSLTRQPASASFLKREQERLEARFKSTLESIQSADREDLPKEFKTQMQEAYEAWDDYRKRFDRFTVEVENSGVLDGKSAGDSRFAAKVWFYVGGIYQFEQIKDREIGRPAPIEYDDTDDADDVGV